MHSKYIGRGCVSHYFTSRNLFQNVTSRLRLATPKCALHERSAPFIVRLTSERRSTARKPRTSSLFWEREWMVKVTSEHTKIRSKSYVLGCVNSPLDTVRPEVGSHKL